MTDTPYCCKMREKYLVAIVAEDNTVETPIDVVDLMDFDVKSPDNRPVIRIKYCPFCGKPVSGPTRISG